MDDIGWLFGELLKEGNSRDKFRKGSINVFSGARTKDRHKIQNKFKDLNLIIKKKKFIDLTFDLRFVGDFLID